MRFFKIILTAVCGICVILSGCSASFCGFRTGGEELVFSCEERLLEKEDEGEKEIPLVSTAVDTEVSVAADGKVDLNAATVEDLVTLNGIGETRAKAIIEYRTQQGPFTCIEDIMQVAGIKEGVFSKIKDQIVVH